MNLHKIFTIYQLCFLIFCAGCAHIEAPVKRLGSENWTETDAYKSEHDWEITAPETVEVLIVEVGPGWGTFGHAGIHIGKYAYSWDYDKDYVLVKQTFKSFLYTYTKIHNRSVTGIVISFPEEAIARLTENLDDEYRRTWNGEYTRGSMFLVNNCSTLVYKALIKASGAKPASWPPILIPDWMGKNIERTFPLLYYNLYKKADPTKGGR